MTATPLGFITARSLYRQRNNYLKDNPDSNDIFNANPEDVKRFAEFNGLLKSIMTRAIMGSKVMSAFIIKGLTEGHDDDDEEWLSNLMKTKSGRRFIQKHLPMGVAMATAATSNDKKGNTLDMILNMFDTYTGKDFDTYKNLRTSLNYAKTDEERNEVWGKFLGNLWTTYNINQVEQITKLKDVFQSAYDSDKIKTVEENEKIAKEVYKNVDGIVDGFLINGAINALQRATNPDENFNRFTKKDW
jgi:hypothetical protein